MPILIGSILCFSSFHAFYSSSCRDVIVHNWMICYRVTDVKEPRFVFTNLGPSLLSCFNRTLPVSRLEMEAPFFSILEVVLPEAAFLVMLVTELFWPARLLKLSGCLFSV